MLVPLDDLPNEVEAELLCALLRTEGIDCDTGRPTSALGRWMNAAVVLAR